MNVIDKIIKRASWIYDRQWDYKYLRNVLKADSVDTAFFGSSYVTFGVNPSVNDVNLSLPSQDIYYSVQLLKLLITRGLKIKTAVLGCGYYSLFCDLSMSKSRDEGNRIYDVYYPLLRDLHNMDGITYSRLASENGIINKMLQFVCNAILPEKKFTYFNNSTHSRERRAIHNWNDKYKRWSELSERERVESAKMRVLSHEKQLEHIHSLKENKMIIESLSDLCKQNDIRLIIFLAPMSKEYKQMMGDNYLGIISPSIDFYKTGADCFFDFNSYEWNEEDFVDPDHLNDLGAKKLSQYIYDCLR